MMMNEQRAGFHTDWGRIELAASENGILAILLPPADRTGRKNGRMPARDAEPSGPASSILNQATQELSEYVDGKRRNFSVPVDLSHGTPFQRRVWRAILRIPYGRVRSYRWVAEKVGGKQYARAVGMALGSNPVPIIVPCHRIIAHDGSLGGFGCGLPMKRRLLKLEGTL
jgi:O-6-methylguanine DNA methyltransferase